MIRLNIQDLDKAFLDKIGELLFWESALRKAGFETDEIRKMLTVSKQRTRKKAAKQKSLSDSEIQSLATKIEERWWDAKADLDIDLKDMVYVALTLEIDGKLWTGDHQLRQGLLQKGFDQFIDFPS